MRFESSQILPSISAGASRASSVVDLQQTVNCAIHAIFTGSPVGSLTIEVSNDPVEKSSLVTNWGLYQTATAISAAGSTAVNIANIGFRWLRVSYAFTSGSGTIAVNYTSKGA